MDKLDRNSFAIGLVIGQSYGSGGHAAGKLAHIEIWPQTTTATWHPETGYYGIGSVTVIGDEKFIPENIKKGVSLFNGRIVGTYEPRLKSESITIKKSGTTTINTPSGYYGLSKVTIYTDFSAPSKTETISANGTYTIKPPSGYGAMSQLSLTVNVPQNTHEHQITISTNGVHNIYPQTGYAGMSKLKLTVDVPQESVTSYARTITVNGDYRITPPSGYRGMSELLLTVNVPVNYKTQTKDAPRAKTYQQTVFPGTGYLLSAVYIPAEPDLAAANIAEGKTICGVSGTYKGGAREPKELTPTYNQLYNGFTVKPSSGYTGLSQVTIYGDKNFTRENIAKGKRIFGLDGTYVSPMKPLTVVPSVDDQRVTPDNTGDYYGFSEVFVPGIEKIGDYGAGYEAGQASRNEEVEKLNDRIEKLGEQIVGLNDEIDKLEQDVADARQDGYNEGYQDGVGDIENNYTNLDLVKF